MITRAIKTGFKVMSERGWPKLFYMVDLHSTVIKPNYQVGNIPTEFYPYAKEVLQMLTKRKDICLIMYTCSHPHEIEEYHEFFKGHDIVFEYVNVNPEVKTQEGGYGCYDTKPYMNVLIDDKAGFDGETEWKLIKELLENKPTPNRNRTYCIVVKREMEEEMQIHHKFETDPTYGEVLEVIYDADCGFNDKYDKFEFYIV